MQESLEKEENCVPVEILIEMKNSALSILERIKSGDVGEAQQPMQEYTALVDRFCQANEHLMAPQQYEAAKVDFEYFLRLLELRFTVRRRASRVIKAKT